MAVCPLYLLRIQVSILTRPSTWACDLVV
ncbi:hypothetical protein F383_21406 [Gossypium arboreum]|uniref:Uncharacterized protein n=1 Tax=Gossypium arboreum TaxID=29729 RepID=A0A0B0NQS1_GOSAR|nr:hypothetical protein F383_21406 [Gossypium arboreum]